MGLLACFGQDGRTQSNEEVRLKHTGCLHGLWVKEPKAAASSPGAKYQKAGSRNAGKSSPITLAWRNSLFNPGSPNCLGTLTPRDQSAAGEAVPTVALRLSVNRSSNNASRLQDVTSPTIASSIQQPSEPLLKAEQLDTTTSAKNAQHEELTACWQQNASPPGVLEAGTVQSRRTTLHGNDGYPDDETSSFVSCAESFASLHSARSQFSMCWQAAEDIQNSSQDTQGSCSGRSSDFGDGVRVLNTINSICSRDASVCVSRRTTRTSGLGIPPASDRSSGSARMQAMVARLSQAKSGTMPSACVDQHLDVAQEQLETGMSSQQGQQQEQRQLQEAVVVQHQQELQQAVQQRLAQQEQHQLHDGDAYDHLKQGLAKQLQTQLHVLETATTVAPDILEGPQQDNEDRKDSNRLIVSISEPEIKTGQEITAPITPAARAVDKTASLQEEREGVDGSSDLQVSASKTELNASSEACAHAWKHAHVLRKSSRQYKQQGHPCGACQTLLAYCKNEGISVAELANQQHLIDSLDLDVDTATMSRLIHAAVMMETAALKVMDDSGWEIVRDDVLRVCYQHQPGTTVHSFKGRTILEAPVEHLVAMTREFDLSKTWNKYAVDTVIVKEYSPAELLCATVLWMPWPLANINLVVEAVGADLLDHMGGFFVAFHSPEDHKDPIHMKGVKGGDPNHMYLKIAPGSCLFFEPLPPAAPGGPPRCRATVEVHTDPGLKHVPAFLVSFILKVMAPFLHSAAVKLLKHEFADDSRPIPARLYERPQFYDMVRKRAEKFLSSRQ